MTARLSSLRVTNYRAFEAPTEALELRPLTLLYGKNNAGKSTLVRLFGVLAESLSEEARGPFVLDGPAGGGSVFRDVLFDPEAGRFGFELTWAPPTPLSAAWVFRLDDQGFTQIERLSVTADGQRLLYLAPDAVALPAEGEQLVTGLSFTGIIHDDREGLPAALRDLRERLRALRGRIQWLGAVRRAPPELIQRPAAVPLRLEPEGQDAAAALLVHARAREEVQGWYRDHCARELRDEPAGGAMHRWRMPPMARPAAPILLRDNGAGMTQLLPVLTAVAMREAGGGPAGSSGLQVIAVEEPTTHLHDDLQIALVGWLAQIATSASAPLMILETHARPMLTGIQLAIAKGVVDEDRVGVWWVDQDEEGRSSYRRVRFDQSGLPLDDALLHVFDDERRLLRELARLRLHGHAS